MTSLHGKSASIEASSSRDIYQHNKHLPTTCTSKRNNINIGNGDARIRKLDNADKTKQGIFLLLLSAFLFSLMGLCLQFTGQKGIPSTELVFIRAVFQGSFVVLGMIFSRVDQARTNDAGSTGKNDLEKGVGERGSARNYDIDSLVDIPPNKCQDGAQEVISYDNYDDDAGDEKKIENPSETTLLIAKTYQQAHVNFTTSDSAANDALPSRLIFHPFGTTPTMRRIVILRGFIGGFGFLNYYYTLSNLPLGDATTLLSLYPIVTIFLARCVLGERIKTFQVMAATMSVAGACLICRPSFLFGSEDDDKIQPGSSRTLGYITALLGSLFASGVIVLIRKAGSIGAHTLQLLLSWAVFGTLFSLVGGIALGMEWRGPHQHSYESVDTSDSGTLENDHQQWYIPTDHQAYLAIMGMCITGSCGHFLLNYAARLAPATVGALLRSSDIGWAYLWQVTILGQQPKKETWWGVFLVCCSLIIVVPAGKDRKRGLKTEAEAGIYKSRPDRGISLNSLDHNEREGSVK